MRRSVVERVVASLRIEESQHIVERKRRRGNELRILRVKLDDDEVDAIRQVHLGAESKVRGAGTTNCTIEQGQLGGREEEKKRDLRAPLVNSLAG